MTEGGTARLQDIAAVARACAGSDPALGPGGLVAGLGGLWPELSFRTVLTRGGWYRPGGVVDIDKQRVAESLRQWAEGLVADGDLQTLLDACVQRPLFATRLVGSTHYLTAHTGPGATDFVQVEVEELREVLDRYLSDPEWLPDSLEEFIDPLEYPQLDPEPVGASRLVFRRILAAAELIDTPADTASALPRFIGDWNGSSAARTGHFCDRWVLAVRETPDSYGEIRSSIRPVPAACSGLPCLDDAGDGATRAGLIQTFDRAAGYPMAWFFHMAASAGGVSSGFGMQVAEDHRADYGYLPACDLAVVRRWAETPYRT